MIEKEYESGPPPQYKWVKGWFGWRHLKRLGYGEGPSQKVGSYKVYIYSGYYPTEVKYILYDSMGIRIIEKGHGDNVDEVIEYIERHRFSV